MKQLIFNSLGSNYSLEFILTSLVRMVFSNKQDVLLLENLLKKEYTPVNSTAEVLTFYKGRDALEAACKVLLNPGDELITQAFSCYAIEEALLRAKIKPVYLDIGQHSSNLTLENLKRCFKAHPRAKAVLLQHSLGISAQSQAISNWCKRHQLLLIEDLAQGIGGVDEQNKKLGVRAEAIVFSFGRDKIIDAVAGGGVIFPRPSSKMKQRIIDLKAKLAKPVSVFSELVYPGLTLIIRKSYNLGLGKVIHFLAKHLGLITSPVKSKTKAMTAMHPSFAKLALFQFRLLSYQVQHRQRLAQEYFRLLSSTSLKFLVTPELIQRSSNLRFSLVCRDANQLQELVKLLKEQGIHLADRWYRQPVDCGQLGCKTVYQSGSCPNAETLATKVLNLPTHREIDLEAVQRICQVIKQVVR